MLYNLWYNFIKIYHFHSILTARLLAMEESASSSTSLPASSEALSEWVPFVSIAKIGTSEKLINFQSEKLIIAKKQKQKYRRLFSNKKITEATDKLLRYTGPKNRRVWQ